MPLFRRRKAEGASDNQPRLAIVSGNDSEGDPSDKVFALSDRRNVIGRDPDCEVRLRSPSVSRRHAAVTVSRDRAQFWVCDLGSRNGVVIQPDRPVGLDPVPLCPGERIRVGEVVLELVRDAVCDSERTVQLDARRAGGTETRSAGGPQGSCAGTDTRP